MRILKLETIQNSEIREKAKNVKCGNSKIRKKTKFQKNCKDETSKIPENARNENHTNGMSRKNGNWQSTQKLGVAES